jgi:hypothetical protein
VPLIKATGARGTGIGYHRQFQNTSPYEWTSSHACPGTKRIAQVPGIIERAKALVEEGDVYVDYPGAAHFKLGNKSDTIGRMNTRLNHKDLGAPDSREFDAQSKAAYAKWQKLLGYSGADADGIPGETSWDRLRVKKTTVIASPDPKPEPAPEPEPEPAPAPPIEEPLNVPALLVRVKDKPAVYAVTVGGAAHIKNPTHLRLLQESGAVTKSIKEISAAELADLLEKE